MICNSDVSICNSDVSSGDVNASLSKENVDCE